MTRDKLRKLAEAVEVTDDTPWYRAKDLAGDGRIQCAEDAAYIIAASPAVVLRLLDDLLALEVASRGYRERAERAEETMMLAVKRADALAATVERVRDLPARCLAGGWYMTSMRDVLRALDGRADA